MSKLTAETIKAYVIASHHDLDAVKAGLAENPELLNIEHKWGENDFETPLGAASHVGNVPIAEYLLDQGAPMVICTAAMLGRIDAVREFIAEDPAMVNARGAHSITLLFHTALSGNVQLAQMLKDKGNSEGHNHALHAAVMNGHTEMARWLLANGVTDTTTKNFQGKTPLEVATELGNGEIITLLKAHG